MPRLQRPASQSRSAQRDRGGTREAGVGADRLEAGSQKGDDQHDHDDFEDNKADPQRLGETPAGGVELIAGASLRRPGKLMLVLFVILFCHNVRCIELLLNFCKIEVRHILFQKIGFTIF